CADHCHGIHRRVYQYRHRSRCGSGKSCSSSAGKSGQGCRRGCSSRGCTGGGINWPVDPWSAFMGEIRLFVYRQLIIFIENRSLNTGESMTLSFQFGTVGAPLGTPKKPGGSVGAIEFSRSIGLDAFELGWVQSVRVTEVTCAAIKQMAEEHKVSLSVHAPYFFNLNATDEEWPKSRKRLMDAAHYGNLAGATDIIFHPGSYFGNDAAEVLKVSIPRLKSCGDELQKAGNPVTLRPETMGKSAMLGSFEDT